MLRPGFTPENLPLYEAVMYESTSMYLQSIRVSDEESIGYWGRRMVVLAVESETEPDGWLTEVRERLEAAATTIDFPKQRLYNLPIFQWNNDALLDLARTSLAAVRPSGRYLPDEVLQGLVRKTITIRSN